MARRIRKAILGRKLGMSQMYDSSRNWVPVTLIEAGPCTVLQIKTEERDGYQGIQVGFDESTRKAMRKPQEVFFKALGVTPSRFIREIPPIPDRELVPGEKLTLSLLEGVESIDVSGTTKGRGFSGVVRRWGHSIGPKSHGSKSKRILGSIGMHQDPGRIIKGQKMPGQHGNVKVKVRNLRVVSMDKEQNLLVVKGAVPGPRGGFLYIEESL
ncbi:MAG: 50S ribosomal protein L3 [Planctomycetota bacterium]